jgi:BirA family transcriptional regulator, biotin operon repressor / biotin---[acetyl-CoA-carboxylase] ligase
MSFGTNCIRLASVDSTNTYAQQLIAQQKAEHGLLIIADEQTHGKGQGGNSWIAEPGQNLTLSLILKQVSVSVQDISLLNKYAAIAVAATIDRLLPQYQSFIKWPNDVIVDRKKIAGILIQNTLEGENISYSTIGIGLNVNQIQFPALDSTFPPTSLALMNGQAFDLEQVLSILMEELSELYKRLEQRAYSFFEQVYLKLLYLYQEWGQYRDKEGSFTGMIIGVNPFGQLVVQKEGQLYSYSTQEITYLS